jgi:hypothetical protein
VKKEQNASTANVRQSVQSNSNQVTLPFRNQAGTNMDVHPNEQNRAQQQGFSVQTMNDQNGRMQQIRQQHLPQGPHPSAINPTRSGHGVVERQGGGGMPLQHYEAVMPQQQQQRRPGDGCEEDGVRERQVRMKEQQERMIRQQQARMMNTMQQRQVHQMMQRQQHRPYSHVPGFGGSALERQVRTQNQQQRPQQLLTQQKRLYALQQAQWPMDPPVVAPPDWYAAPEHTQQNYVFQPNTFQHAPQTPTADMSNRSESTQQNPKMPRDQKPKPTPENQNEVSPKEPENASQGRASPPSIFSEEALQSLTAPCTELELTQEQVNAGIDRLLLETAQQERAQQVLNTPPLQQDEHELTEEQAAAAVEALLAARIREDARAPKEARAREQMLLRYLNMSSQQA